MDMMFVHDKGFQNDVEMFINLFWKIFVVVRKFGRQFFIGKSVCSMIGAGSLDRSDSRLPAVFLR